MWEVKIAAYGWNLYTEKYEGGGWSEENNQQDLLGKPSHPQKKYIYLEQ